MGLPRDRRGGGIALNAPVANRERDLDELFPRTPDDALVVVDQVRNIGPLALKRAARGAPQQAVGDLPIVGHGVRQRNKRLKNLLIFSCNSLFRSDNRFGEFYRKCRDRGMPHGKAVKTVARKRLKAIYAIMRDKVPYAA